MVSTTPGGCNLAGVILVFGCEPETPPGVTACRYATTNQGAAPAATRRRPPTGPQRFSCLLELAVIRICQGMLTTAAISARIVGTCVYDPAREHSGRQQRTLGSPPGGRSSGTGPSWSAAAVGGPGRGATRPRGAESSNDFLVDAARDEGATWEQIGTALGISRQGSRQAKARRDELEVAERREAVARRTPPATATILVAAPTKQADTAKTERLSTHRCGGRGPAPPPTPPPSSGSRGP